METKATFFGDIVEENGKTVKENNLENKHVIPIGSLVEVLNPEESKGLRLFVMRHTRDADGTPLYALTGDADYIGFELPEMKNLQGANRLDIFLEGRSRGIDIGKVCGEWSEESLKIICLDIHDL